MGTFLNYLDNKEFVHYIHLNPLRANMINDFRALNRYAFSGHRLLSGKGECGWQDAAYVLGCFNKNTASARERYLAYVKAGITVGRRPELVGGGLIRSVGGWAEVKKMRLKGMKLIYTTSGDSYDEAFLAELFEITI